MPGTDAREAARTVTGALEGPPHLPHLPELPARGPGADMTGRTAGLLVDMYTQLEPSGWRFCDRPGRDTRRARSWLGEDLDALEEFAQGYSGALKVSVVGPWTLAATVQRRNGEAVLGDPGARRDLAASLTEGVVEHLAEVRRRVPGAHPVLQLDEPSLGAVLRGDVRTASGYRAHPAVDRALVEGALRALIERADVPTVVHSCGAVLPVRLLRRAGAAGISFDAALLADPARPSPLSQPPATVREQAAGPASGEPDRRDERDALDEALGEAVEGGTALFAGVVPPLEPESGALSDPTGSVGVIRSLWRRLGLAPGLLAETVVVTPSCGMAGASPAYAREALAHCVRSARSLADDPE
ncbi:methionine synthase [Streptomyces sp. AJS327]|uniref:methionine synthase n=1 Tax=Streptomyces sp. AJS327 TaxID=2545265 RepID=UPI00182C6386|nr:methionine synthase [Streptomyces sp. AJS327]MBA0051727.1 methionine synthase [Streptomyces sp. AJS327]